MGEIKGVLNTGERAARKSPDCCSAAALSSLPLGWARQVSPFLLEQVFSFCFCLKKVRGGDGEEGVR